MLKRNFVPAVKRLLIQTSQSAKKSTFPSYGLEKKWAHHNQAAITEQAEKVFIY